MYGPRVDIEVLLHRDIQASWHTIASGQRQRSTTYLARLHATLTDVDNGNGKTRRSGKGVC